MTLVEFMDTHYGDALGAFIWFVLLTAIMLAFVGFLAWMDRR